MSCVFTRSGCGQYYRNGRDFKFWETNEKRKLKQPQIQEREKQLAAINKDLPAVLRELLGINYEREFNKYFVDTDEDNRRLAFLSDDKRAQFWRCATNSRASANGCCTRRRTDNLDGGDDSETARDRPGTGRGPVPDFESRRRRRSTN